MIPNNAVGREGRGSMLLNEPGGQTALSFAHVERGTNWLR